MYYQLRCFLKYVVVKLFFRQIDIVGSFRVPTKGPVIFVANHANQFVDPMMIITTINRVVRFLIAAKSLRREVIGDLARAAQAIGVERPQDLMRTGAGTISLTQGSCRVDGSGTHFESDLQVGYKMKAGDVEVTVTSVEDNTTCFVAPCSEAFQDSEYKITPKVDQSAMYENVHAALKGGDCIGIFPEGGSHDQTTLLDLKPGAAIMALGAMQAGSDPVWICPCGLNYFEPYRFRSRVVVEFGQPFQVPATLAARYATDKRGAVQDLMAMIESGMRSVMPGAADYGELQAIITMRALYKPEGVTLSAEESLRITKGLMLGLKKEHQNPRVQALVRDVQDYNNVLQAAGLRDRDVRENLADEGSALSQFFYTTLQALLLAPLAIVFYVLFSPVALTTYFAALREKRTALKSSSVKVKALDVVASKKIIVGLVVFPVYAFVISIIVTLICGFGWVGFVTLILLVWPSITSVAVLVCDHFWKSLTHCRTFLLSCKTKSLIEHRIHLQLRVRELVEELGPEALPDFHERRVIAREDVEADNLRLLAKLEEGSEEDAPSNERTPLLNE
eukprot:TRINITY_DN74266_c0_g1_i1.p1 TRINITY_DN74266_c0_g1~~TRINITY_DN74266_c0_g1_i1.p1  ORF type:complete len:563 (+),score=65.00 TRINITY_DN74266_c0_g1_i1:62-1750(+)